MCGGGGGFERVKDSVILGLGVILFLFLSLMSALLSLAAKVIIFVGMLEIFFFRINL